MTHHLVIINLEVKNADCKKKQNKTNTNKKTQKTKQKGWLWKITEEKHVKGEAEYTLQKEL